MGKVRKRPASRLSDQRKAPQKKMACKWILKKNSGTMSNEASKDVEDKHIQVSYDDHITSDGLTTSIVALTLILLVAKRNLNLSKLQKVT